MRRRLLFGKFDHISIYRGGVLTTSLDISVGEIITDLEVFGVYKNGKQVKITNTDCVWSSDGAGVYVVADSGYITGITGSNTPVNVTVTHTKGTSVFSATIPVTVHNYDYKYFINANADSTLACTYTRATFGYTLYKTAYDNGVFVKAELTADTIDTTLAITGDATGNYNLTSNKYVLDGLDNKHNSQTKTYVGTFSLNGSYEVETVNFGGFSHNNSTTIIHLADTEKSADYNTYEYGDLVLSLDTNLLSFSNEGGTKEVTASTTQSQTVITHWESDDAEKTRETSILTDNATFAWGGSISPFTLSGAENKTASISVATTSSSTNTEKTLTVTATSSKDSKTATASVSLVQSSKTIVAYEEISLKEGTLVNSTVASKGGATTLSASYQQIARWSDNSTTVVNIPASNVNYAQHTFESLGTTPTTGETVVSNAITVIVTGLGDTPTTSSFKYDARQSENTLVSTEYLTPTISYSGDTPIIIPASGGSATADISKVSVMQKKKETYSSEASIEKDADVTSATKSASTVTASSLGTKVKDQTKVGSSIVSITSNGVSSTKDIDVEQEANVNHDGSKGEVVTYSDWRVYFTKDETTSYQNIYLDEKFGDDSHVEPSNANDTYNNDIEVLGTMFRSGESKDIHVRAVRTKITTKYFTSGEICHIEKAPEYYGEVVTSGLTVTCDNGVTMGTLSSPDSHFIMTSVFPNPGSNHTLKDKTWTITASLDGITTTISYSQIMGTIYWSAKTPSVIYDEAEATANAQSTHSTLDASMSWWWNSESDNKTTVTASAKYELVGTVPTGVSIDENTGVITWSKNDADSRSVEVKITLTALSGVSGASDKVVSNTVVASQKSGLSIDYYTITGYELKTTASSENINAAGGSITISRSGKATYTETYVSGTTSASKTKDIPSSIITVAESGDTYGTFGEITWNGADGTVNVSSHKTNVRNEQTVKYTPSVAQDDLKALFSGTVSSVGTASIITASVKQSKNQKEGSTYNDVVVDPSSKSIEFEANGGTIDTQISVSQTYYDYYTSYNDGDIAEGKTSLLNVDASVFTFGAPVESGSYIDSFTPSYQTSDNKHYLRIVAEINATTSTRSGYNATMTITGANSKNTNIVVSASQKAGTETYKYFIVAGADKNMDVTGTSASFTYKLYRTVYVTNVYKSCAEAIGTVTGTYSGSISGSGSSTSETMSKVVSSNAHNKSTKTYTVTYEIPSGTTKETTNFGGYTADYTQTITHLADEYDSSKTSVEYTDYSAWIGSSADSSSNVSTIDFSKAGETKTLYGFSKETKTTRYYWKSDSSEDASVRVVETLTNDSTWVWSQPSTTGWSLSNTTSRNASESVSANDTISNRSVVVTLKATSNNNASNTASPTSTMSQEAGLNYKYFIVADADSTITCTATSATFSYKVIANAYDGAGSYLNSSLYNGSGVDVTVLFEGTDSYTVTGTNRSVTVNNIISNAHSTTAKTYTSTFAFVTSSLQDTQNLNVTALDGKTYKQDNEQIITQSADSQTGTEIIEYTNHYITVDSKVSFVKEGETKSITATPSVTKNVYKTWASDNTKVSTTPTSTSEITTSSSWDWSWVLTNGTVFSIDANKANTNPTSVTVGVNNTSSTRTDTLKVTGTLKADSSVKRTVSIAMEQAIGHVLQSLVLTINDADGVINYNGSAPYTVIAKYSDGNDVDVTTSATINGYTTSSGTTKSDKYTYNATNKTINGNNLGTVTDAYYEIEVKNVSGYSASINTIQTTKLYAEKVNYSESNTASANVDVYFEATFDGMSSSRSSLTINGQSASSATVINRETPSDITWSIISPSTTEASLVSSGNTVEFIPVIKGTYTIKGVYGSTNKYGVKDITVSIADNNITISQSTTSLSEFTLKATYAPYTDIDYRVTWIVVSTSATASGDGVFSKGQTTSVFDSGESNTKYVSAFIGTKWDDRYNYIYNIMRSEYTDLRITLANNSIVYNGSTNYTIEIYDNVLNQWFDATDVVSLYGYKTNVYTSTNYSPAIANSSGNTSGSIIGSNNGNVLSEYDSIYVSPTVLTTYVGVNSSDIFAYSRHYSAGNQESTEKTVYLKATYSDLEATNTISVGGQEATAQTVSAPTAISANWIVFNSTKASVTSATGESTALYSDVVGTYVVMANKPGYTALDNANECSVDVNAIPAKQLVANNITMNWSEYGNVGISATYNGEAVTGLSYTSYDTTLCSIGGNSRIYPKKAGQTPVTISKDGYESTTILLTVVDDRVSYDLTFTSEDPWVQYANGFNATIQIVSTILGTSSETLTNTYGMISVFGFAGDQIYYTANLDTNALLLLNNGTSGDTINTAICSDMPVQEQITMPQGGGSKTYTSTPTGKTPEKTDYTINVTWDNGDKYAYAQPCDGTDGHTRSGVNILVTNINDNAIILNENHSYTGASDTYYFSLIPGYLVTISATGEYEYRATMAHTDACAYGDTSFNTNQAIKTTHNVTISIK